MGNIRKSRYTYICCKKKSRFGFDTQACVVENGIDSEECLMERESVLDPWNKLENPSEMFTMLILVIIFVTSQYANLQPVVGNVMVDKDTHYISATYANTLEPINKKRINESIS